MMIFLLNGIANYYIEIYGKFMGYYVSYNGSKPKFCYVRGKNPQDVAHKICQQDTGSSCPSTVDNCMYSY